jgi:hypothetical protein
MKQESSNSFEDDLYSLSRLEAHIEIFLIEWLNWVLIKFAFVANAFGFPFSIK